MSVAKAYAKALLEAAQDAKLSAQDLDSLETQLESVSGSLEGSNEARVALMGPAVASKEKGAAIREIASRSKLSPLLTQFLVLLAMKERLPLLSEICESFASVRMESEGGVLGKIISADSMGNDDIENLAQSFTKKLGKRVAFQASTDPELLAGMKVVVNGVTYDGTLRSQLQRLKDRLVTNSFKV